jgi:hypothetical protein
MFYFLFFFAICVLVWYFYKPSDRGGAQPVDIPEIDYDNLQYFGARNNGNYVSVWPKDHGDVAFECNIVGCFYRHDIQNYIGEFKGYLMAEPGNRHDSNAIKVMAEDGHCVGYIPRNQTKKIRQNHRLPCDCYCFIDVRMGDEGPLFFTCVYLKY